ncbi:MAG TPA: GNAT family N-acetyltransferase [Polyangiaceae bacterium]
MRANPPIHVRSLERGDEPALARFLSAHADAAMFLRSNLRAAGLVDEGKPLQGTWVGAFDGRRIVAVAVHGWNGIILVQAESDAHGVELGRAALAAVDATRERGRATTGIIGPFAHVGMTRTALGLDARKASLEDKEYLYALDLVKLVLPRGAVGVRPTRDEDLELCAAWRVDYGQEAMSMSLEESRARARADVERTHGRGDSFLLEDADGTPVSYSAFNARLPDAVQIGGVWTPKELRGKGYARSVVAGSLVLARALGVTRATHFTGRWNTPAQKAYEALGFERIGDYGIVYFSS